MLSNLSVGMQFDLLCYVGDSLKVAMKRRFERRDICFEVLMQQWIIDTRKVLHDLSQLEWQPAG